MFNTINEVQYLEIVDYAHIIYNKDVIKGTSVSSLYYTLELQRLRTESAFNKYKSHFETKDEATIFKLNLLVSNNGLFAELFLDDCSKFLKETDIKKITRSFRLRKIVMPEEWEQIINSMAASFCLKPQTATAKIMEVLAFANIHYKPADNKIDSPTKSLSLR
jgi:hypothetical protein